MLSRLALFEIMCKSKGHAIFCKQSLQDLKTELLKRTSCPKGEETIINKSITTFYYQCHSKWTEVHRNKDFFLKINDTWLNQYMSFPKYSINSSSEIGRPSKTFYECAERTKRQKTEKLRREHSSEELVFAGQMSLRSSGQLEASKVIKDITQTTPTRAIKYRNAYSRSREEEPILSGEEALAMIIDAKLSRDQYLIIRSKDPKKFPSYKIIQEAKKQCYPHRESIVVTNTSAEVTLQSLLDHTAIRLIEVQKEVMQVLSENLKHIFLISKWGFDGSSGHSEYKQRMGDEEQSDASMFLTSMVPIQLRNDKFKKDNTKILWQNLSPSSTRWCRPIKFVFAKETSELAIQEKTYIENQIRQLKSTKIALNDKEIEVHHELLFTMIDGKICNSVTGTKSALRCYICGLTSKDFNDLKKSFESNCKEEHYQFGLSVLHNWIRFFETLLHIAYKLPIKKWQARSQEDKNIVETRKKEIQKEFKQKLGLLVDKPKPGYGSTNDGNTARRFFYNAETSAEITGCSLQIIKRFHIILQTIACGYEIDIEKFKKYTYDTAKKYVEEYPWYPMPTTIHKILLHSPEIISAALLPIGQLSEEAQESVNKEFKRIRRDLSRKTSRISSNTDIFNTLMVSSDPIISTIRRKPQKKIKTLSEDAVQLLKPPADPQSETDDDESNDEEEEEEVTDENI